MGIQLTFRNSHSVTLDDVVGCLPHSIAAQQLAELRSELRSYKTSFEQLEAERDNLSRWRTAAVRRSLDILNMIKDEEDRYGIGSMSSMWTGPDIAKDIEERLEARKE